MAGIMIFISDYEGTDLAGELTARGLGSLLDSNVDALPTRVAKGPTGGPGMLVTFYPGDTPREYVPASQTWMEAPPDGDLLKGRYWLGYVTNAKPTPEELRRVDLIDGEPVVLCDNKVWVIPCSEFAPKRLSRDPETGEQIKVVQNPHTKWVDWSNDLFALFMSDGFQAIVARDHVVNIPNGLPYAALTLSKNYRVNTDVVDLLELVGEFEAFQIARAATGMRIIEKLVDQKKSMEPSFQSAASS